MNRESSLNVRTASIFVGYSGALSARVPARRMTVTCWEYPTEDRVKVSQTCSKRADDVFQPNRKYERQGFEERTSLESPTVRRKSPCRSHVFSTTYYRGCQPRRLYTRTLRGYGSPEQAHRHSAHPYGRRPCWSRSSAVYLRLYQSVRASFTNSLYGADAVCKP